MIKANGIDICYDDLGSGLLPVIFLHGFPFNKEAWAPQINVLKDTHRVIAFDNRGFGKSGKDSEKTTITLMANDLIRFMDALNIEKAVVAGLSMGGYILLNAVIRFPSRFEGIVLCDTQCISDTDEAREKRYKTIEQIEKGGQKEFAEGFIPKLFGKKTFDEKPEVVQVTMQAIMSTSPGTLTATLDALAQRTETCTGLKNIVKPTLIICGEEDTITPPAQSEKMHKAILQSKNVIIPGAGHLSNLEQPESFNQHLLDFLKAVESGE